jgi:hypothetical protein
MNDLIAKYRSAAYVYRLLEETGASADVLAQQLAHCRELRSQINADCPDNSTYDPMEHNIVHAPV